MDITLKTGEPARFLLLAAEGVLLTADFHSFGEIVLLLRKLRPKKAQTVVAALLIHS